MLPLVLSVSTSANVSVMFASAVLPGITMLSRNVTLSGISFGSLPLATKPKLPYALDPLSDLISPPLFA